MVPLGQDSSSAFLRRFDSIDPFFRAAFILLVVKCDFLFEINKKPGFIPEHRVPYFIMN